MTTPRRLVTAAAVSSLLLLVVGFAPAPLPKRDTGIDLTKFQGMWKVVGHHTWSAKGGKQVNPWQITHIRVEKDRWSLMEKGRVNATYRIEIHPDRKPSSHIDWRGNEGQLLWMGLIRRSGKAVEVIYLTSTHRPENYDTPSVGSTLITLERSDEGMSR